MVKLIFKALKSTYVVVSMLFIAVVTAMAVFSGLLDLDSTFFHWKHFKPVSISFSILVFIAVLCDKIAKLKRDERFFRASYVINDANEKMTAYVLHELLWMKTSGKLKEIISDSKAKVEKHFKELVKEIKGNIEDVVTKDILDQYEKIDENPAKQQQFMLSLLNRFSSFNTVDKYIANIHKSCLDEIETELNGRIKDILKKYYSSVPRFSFSKKYNRKKFNLDIDDIESIIKREHHDFKEIGLADIFSVQTNVADMKLASMFGLLGLNIEDIGSGIYDEMMGELSEAALYEVLENIGIGLGIVAPAFIVLKIARFIYKHRDRSEDLAGLREKLTIILTKHINDISERTKEKLEKDGNGYIDKLETIFKVRLEKAAFYKRNAQANI